MNESPYWLDEIPTFVPSPTETYTDPVWDWLDVMFGTIPLAEFIEAFYELIPILPV